jgi:mono/diheme cytochrome c family protein
MKPSLCIAALALLPLSGCNGTYHPSNWLQNVPPADHALSDPLPKNPVNLAAGHDTYALYCVSCHNEDGSGRRGRPSLRTARVRGESDGDIFWILHNGSRNHGMPSWRSLGDPALWQLVQYIRSLPPQAKQQSAAVARLGYTGVRQHTGETH